MRLKNLIIGSPFESIARKAHHFLTATPVTGLAAINAAYDEQTREVMRRWLNGNSNCVDIGCHKGTILKEMLRIAPAGTHYAFEPLPELYEELLLSFPGVKIYGVALSDSVGEVSFQHVVTDPSYSGLKRRQYASPNETVEEIRVKTELLDNIISEDISLMKIDVEGGELQVLRGAVSTIRKNKPVIVFEHGLGAADYYGTTPEQVYDLLTECGLCLSLMKDWLKGDAPLTREGFAARFYQGEFYFMAHPESSNHSSV
jgi:FkbM family methyltransferase